MPDTPDPVGPWFSSAAECLACGCEWAAAYEGNPLFLQCPECGEMTGVRVDEDD